MQFRRKIGAIKDEVSDDELQDTILPIALDYFNATCRQSFTISDYTQATVGTSVDNYITVDNIISLLACYEAWETRKRYTVLKGPMEYPEYRVYRQDAWDKMGPLYPNLMKYVGTPPNGGYVPDPAVMHGPVTPVSYIAVGDSVLEGGIRYVESTQNVTESDR